MIKPDCFIRSDDEKEKPQDDEVSCLFSDGGGFGSRALCAPWAHGDSADTAHNDESYTCDSDTSRD